MSCIKPCNILLPKEDIDLFAYSCVACDQFTSDAQYWEEVKKIAGDKPSAYNITFPEIYLSQNNSERIKQINKTMQLYMQTVFREKENTIMYIERTLASKKVRRGIVLACDLEAYDYSKDTHSLIRPTEGTIADRLPPRCEIRKNACLELPHIMLLINDAKKTIIEPLEHMEKTLEYSTSLMQNGGSIKGYSLSKKAQEHILDNVESVACTENGNTILLAVGDGNHSLATAKKCWEELKTTLSPQQAENHPARFALCEIVNLHDDSLVFEPIHRVLFNIDIPDFLNALKKIQGNGQECAVTFNGSTEKIGLTPSHSLAVGTVQNFLDDYINLHKNVRIDYVHEAERVVELAKQPNTLGILLEKIDKSDLFPSVCKNGALPRKTFSMGTGNEKRYYFEARKIK